MTSSTAGKAEEKNAGGGGGGSDSIMCRFVVFVLLTALVGVLLLSADERHEGFAMGRLSDRGIDRKVPLEACGQFCSSRREQRIRKHGGVDWVDTPAILGRVKAVRSSVVDRLRSAEFYGPEVFDAMFLDGDTGRARRMFVSAKLGASIHSQRGQSSAGIEDDGPSPRRFQRKLQMKILRSQAFIKHEMEHLEGCNCTEQTLGAPPPPPPPPPLQQDQGATTELEMGQRQRRRHRRRHRHRRGLQEEAPPKRQIVLPPVPRFYSQFVWVTGGHSAAASHGNFMNESYTDFMHAALQDIFEAAGGIQFVAKNYAMGGTPSGPELALCNEAVFGLDADVISWDFGMMEVYMFWMYHLYAHRVASHRNRPALFGMILGGTHEMRIRSEAALPLEENGMTVMHMDNGPNEAMKGAIPDMATIPPEQAANVGRYARNFKCGDKIEEGDPFCGDEKYTAGCDQRIGKASWHPGWKWHAMHGHAMALFMMDALVGAIEDLIQKQETTGVDATELYRQLKAEEDEDYARLATTAEMVPDQLRAILQSPSEKKFPACFGLDPKNMEDYKEGQVTPNVVELWRNSILCHTARTPAESRYRGLVDDAHDGMGLSNYYVGEPFAEYRKAQADAVVAGNKETLQHSSSSPKPMQLCHDDNRERDEKNCPGIPTRIDYKDFWVATEPDGWASLTIPSNKEMDYYAQRHDLMSIVTDSLRGVGDGGADASVTESSKEKGRMLMLCFGSCDWEKCPDGEVRHERFDNLDMAVNRHTVTEMVLFYRDCVLLRHQDGFYFEADSNGFYTLHVKVGLWNATKPDVFSYMRLSSMIVI